MLTRDFNIMQKLDSYKVPHWKCYPKDTEKLYIYFEARGGKYPTNIFFGLQYYLKFLEGQIVTKERIEFAAEFAKKHFGREDVFNRAGWEYIEQHHGGCLPIEIQAVPEGMEIPVSTPLFVIINKDPHRCAWLSGALETYFSKVWYPTTIATQDFHVRKQLEALIAECGGDPASIVWKVHDFGYRGVSSEETAYIGGGAHLISFMGTDTLPGIEFMMDNYGSDVCGYSIPATEHSVMCSFGRDNEVEACRNFLETFPTGLIACVSDTYDIYNCVENIWGGVLRDMVLARNGTLVIRPDSGDYMEVVPRVLQILFEKFGGTSKQAANGKWYKTLDSHVRVIQGDGMNPESIVALFRKIVDLGWSTDNLVTGSGGGLLQKVDRDTCKFAIKCSAALRGGHWIDVYKEPITDPGKKSKRGRFQTVKMPDGKIVTTDFTYNKPFGDLLLRPVFDGGKILKTFTLDEVKKNAFLT